MFIFANQESRPSRTRTTRCLVLETRYLAGNDAQSNGVATSIRFLVCPRSASASLVCQVRRLSSRQHRPFQKQAALPRYGTLLSLTNHIYFLTRSTGQCGDGMSHSRLVLELLTASSDQLRSIITVEYD